MKRLYYHFIHLLDSVSEVFGILFSSDMNVISKEAQKNLTNSHDMQEFYDAIMRLREKEREIIKNEGFDQAPESKFKLKNNKEITLTR